MAEDQMSVQAISRSSKSWSTFQAIGGSVYPSIGKGIGNTNKDVSHGYTLYDRGEDGHEPLDVQVVIQETEGGAVQLQLQDAGVFLDQYKSLAHHQEIYSVKKSVDSETYGHHHCGLTYSSKQQGRSTRSC